MGLSAAGEAERLRRMGVERNGMVEVDGRTCPHCGTLVDASSNLRGSDGVETDGDVVVCLYCGGICVSDASRSLRKASADEIRGWDDFETVVGASNYARMMNGDDRVFDCNRRATGWAEVLNMAMKNRVGEVVYEGTDR